MAAAQTVTLKVRCVESGRHPIAGQRGELRLAVQNSPQGPVASAEFLPRDGKRLRFAGVLAPLGTGDRPTALRVDSPRTRYLFDVLPDAPPRPVETRQYAICRDGVPLRGCDAVPATHETLRRYTLSADLAGLAVGDACVASYGLMILTVRRVA